MQLPSDTFAWSGGCYIRIFSIICHSISSEENWKIVSGLCKIEYQAPGISDIVNIYYGYHLDIFMVIMVVLFIMVIIWNIDRQDQLQRACISELSTPLN